MRTTVSIEPDLARQLEQRMATERKGVKQVLNETLRIAALALEYRGTLTARTPTLRACPVCAGAIQSPAAELAAKFDQLCAFCAPSPQTRALGNL
jgi:hypothetical protein